MEDWAVALLSKRAALINTENAFKVGPYIRQLEDQGKKVIKCNLGEPDFPIPAVIKDEVKQQIDKDNTHYCDPQGILPLRKAVAKYLGESRGIRPPRSGRPADLLRPRRRVVYPSPGSDLRVLRPLRRRGR
jgi:histidinol-phosphate/aromatic aminotransferase/cobyric acid decarboxylase-like protein